MPDPGIQQQIHGSFNAQAAEGGIATVNVYQDIEPAPIGEEELAAAQARLAELPLDTIPQPGALPAGSLMPYGANPLFVGRAADLKALAGALKGGGTAAVGQIAAATGLGGIGKTQLASELVHRYGRYFTGRVFWLSLADAAAVPAQVALCGRPGALGLRADYDNLGQDDQVRLVLGAWQSELPRLLVFDNCEEEELLARWRPPAGAARVLATSRRGHWSLALGVQALELGLLAPAESRALLHKHRPDLDAEDPALAAIAEELGHLPLALHLAGSFLRRYRHSAPGDPQAYLARLQSADLLAHPSLSAGELSPTGHEQHVARTFALSYERLDAADENDTLALGLLARAACFAPGEPIPRPLLLATAEIEEQDEAALLRGEDALGRLVALGLIEQEGDSDLVLHRLLQAFVVRTGKTTDVPRSRGVLRRLLHTFGIGQAHVAAPAVEQTLLAEAQRINEGGLPAALTRWQVHLRAVAEGAAAAGREAAGALFNELGYHLKMVADLAGAREAFARALAIDEAAFGPEHSNVARDVNNLGSVMQDQASLAAAREAYQRALAIDEAASGPDHPKVARDVNNLGMVMQDEGDLAAAREAFTRALAIDEAAFGPDHPSVARDVNNLGSVMQDQGDLAGAREAYQRALAIDEAAFGPDHPNVAIRVNNLGEVMRAESDLAGAREAFARALAIDEAAFGPDHPNVAIFANNLGMAMKDQGDLAGAREAYQRALAIDEAAFGPDHPKVAIRVNNLGMVMKDEGDLAAAREAYQRALVICEQTLGADHPDTRTVRNNLSSLDTGGG